MDITDLPWEPNPLAYEIRKATVIAIHRIMEWDDVFEFQKKRIFKHVLLWDLTESAEQNLKGQRGKFMQVTKKYNLRYWSKEAIGSYDINSPARYKNLRHEHVIERDTLLRFLESDLSIDDKIAILTMPENVPSCVVSIEENKKLNKVKDQVGWERYADLGINVFDRMEGKYIDPHTLHNKIDTRLLG